MMQCPQCQTANRLGAIFCRSCGAKLEIDSVTSQTFEQVTGVVPKDKAKGKKRVKSIIINSLRLVFLAALVFGVYLALQRPEVDQPKTEEAAAKDFKNRRTRLIELLQNQGEYKNAKFATKGINSYLASLMAETEDKGKTLQLVDSWVNFGDDGALTWVIDAKLFGRLLRFQYMGTLEVKDDKVVFTPDGFFSGKLGKLPYPTFFIQSLTKRLWNSVLDDGDNKTVIEAISELKTAKDELTISVKK
ncbi:MAG: zinc ribbon domain-containing protein [Verrucomicrobia bacterium]|nr:zinc ribbon domain-containing protein [Verrucomicrobiota bacterium]